mmetsp:Transcript_6794/g.13460  ORF Transcript_6794/g.13460 Transcript_6794/m.13460 type:complete len:356 (+) Transcript_6794:1578-2645(+)|eukprot:scaffold34653_cov254-Amphora_coffeaeformis.AAC.4
MNTPCGDLAIIGSRHLRIGSDAVTSRKHAWVIHGLSRGVVDTDFVPLVVRNGLQGLGQGRIGLRAKGRHDIVTLDTHELVVINGVLAVLILFRLVEFQGANLSRIRFGKEYLLGQGVRQYIDLFRHGGRDLFLGGAKVCGIASQTERDATRPQTIGRPGAINGHISTTQHQYTSMQYEFFRIFFLFGFQVGGVGTIGRGHSFALPTGRFQKLVAIVVPLCGSHFVKDVTQSLGLRLANPQKDGIVVLLRQQRSHGKVLTQTLVGVHRNTWQLLNLLPFPLDGGLGETKLWNFPLSQSSHRGTLFVHVTDVRGIRATQASQKRGTGQRCRSGANQGDAFRWGGVVMSGAYMRYDSG